MEKSVIVFSRSKLGMKELERILDKFHYKRCLQKEYIASRENFVSDVRAQSVRLVRDALPDHPEIASMLENLEDGEIFAQLQRCQSTEVGLDAGGVYLVRNPRQKLRCWDVRYNKWNLPVSFWPARYLGDRPDQLRVDAWLDGMSMEEEVFPAFDLVGNLFQLVLISDLIDPEGVWHCLEDIHGALEDSEEDVWQIAQAHLSWFQKMQAEVVEAQGSKYFTQVDYLSVEEDVFSGLAMEDFAFEECPVWMN